MHCNTEFTKQESLHQLASFQQLMHEVKQCMELVLANEPKAQMLSSSRYSTVVGLERRCEAVASFPGPTHPKRERGYYPTCMVSFPDPHSLHVCVWERD